MLEPGVQLDNRYEVVRLIGAGAMATVYQVRHIGLHSMHALKVLNPDLAEREDLRGRFLNEGRIQALVKHPNVVQVTEIVTQPPGLVMDLVEGPDLAKYVQSRSDELRAKGEPSTLPAQEVLDIMLPVLDALDLAHSFGIVHRDLKPENVIVGRDQRGKLVPKVTDFGIAKVLDGAKVQNAKSMTMAGTRMGTLLYMSPEQVRGAEDLDRRSDIFALGAILYEVVTGRVAFDAPSEFDTMRKIVEGTFEPPERVVGGLPAMFAACIRKALAIDPNERFQDCASFRKALENALDPAAPLPARPSRSYAVTQVPAAPEPQRAPTHVPSPQPSWPAPQDARASRTGTAPPPLASAAAQASQPQAQPAYAYPPQYPPAPQYPAAQYAPPQYPQATYQPPVGHQLPIPAQPVFQPPVYQMPQPVYQPVPANCVPPDSSTSPVVAVLLSLFCLYGAGQFYNGQIGKGVVVLIAGIALATATMGVSMAVFPIIAAVDAGLIAGKRKQGKAVGRWEWF